MLNLMSQGAMKQPEELGGIDWQLYTGIAQVGIADYTSAEETWTSQLNMLNRQAASGQLYGNFLYTLPMVADVNIALNEAVPVWPFRNSTMSGDAVGSANEGRAEISLLIGLMQMEHGNLSGARKSLSRIITEYGNTRAVGVARFYYSMLDEKALSLFEQNFSKVWEEFEYPGEVLPTAQNEATSTKPPLSDLLPAGDGNNSPNQPANAPGQ
jgi:hypothetical protein